jgi:hypothetical protein
MKKQTPWAILRCKWDGADDEPRTDAYYENMFTVAGVGTPNLVDYFDVCSHGQVDAGGSRVFDWIRLPYRQSDYAGNVEVAPEGKINRTGLVAAARTAAVSAGIDLTGFVGAVVVMNTPTDLFGELGGWGALCDGANVEPFVVAQEMLHVFGLDHSRVARVPDLDYRDPWDTMSAALVDCVPAGPYGRWGPGLNAANMRSLGWLDRSRVLSVHSDENFTTKTVRLRPLHARELPGYLAIEVDDFIVEFRDSSGWDGGLREEVVLVHSFADGHSFLEPAFEGTDYVKLGDKWSPFPDLAYIEVSFDELDREERIATLTLKRKPGTNIHNELRVGGDLTLPWVDGGGFIGAGSRVVITKPGDRLGDVVAKLVDYRTADGVRDLATRTAIKRQAMEDVAWFAQSEVDRLNATNVRSPAPPAGSGDG